MLAPSHPLLHDCGFPGQCPRTAGLRQGLGLLRGALVRGVVPPLQRLLLLLDLAQLPLDLLLLPQHRPAGRAAPAAAAGQHGRQRARAERAAHEPRAVRHQRAVVHPPGPVPVIPGHQPVELLRLHPRPQLHEHPVHVLPRHLVPPRGVVPQERALQQLGRGGRRGRPGAPRLARGRLGGRPHGRLGHPAADLLHALGAAHVREHAVDLVDALRVQVVQHLGGPLGHLLHQPLVPHLPRATEVVVGHHLPALLVRDGHAQPIDRALELVRVQAARGVAVPEEERVPDAVEDGGPVPLDHLLQVRAQPVFEPLHRLVARLVRRPGREAVGLHLAAARLALVERLQPPG
mmetsp:Transcript_31474/g.54318  ORF Transcript_31474/g.54318 Transcript_31474/m.54318 type:complete len:347 (+) Transcript_31474:367-1407(+)